MRIVGVSRILNEEDIIEQCIRHNGGFVDHHIILDNGSTDRTIEILRSLRDEGFPLTLYQNRSPVFSEVSYNTFLYRQAVTARQADWVVFLDADEFLDDRREPAGLRHALAALPPSVDLVRIALENYYRCSAPPGGEGPLDVIDAFTMKETEPGKTFKIIARASLIAHDIAIEAGNHGLTTGDGYQPQKVDFASVGLAHFPMRSVYHAISKAFIGRLKVLAAGRQATDGFDRNTHYQAYIDYMKSNPNALLREVDLMDLRDTTIAVTAATFERRGGPLRYARPLDDAARAIMSVSQYVESLALAHGALIDQNQLLGDHYALVNNMFNVLVD